MPRSPSATDSAGTIRFARIRPTRCRGPAQELLRTSVTRHFAAPGITTTQDPRQGSVLRADPGSTPDARRPRPGRSAQSDAGTVGADFSHGSTQGTPGRGRSAGRRSPGRSRPLGWAPAARLRADSAPRRGPCRGGSSTRRRRPRSHRRRSCKAHRATGDDRPSARRARPACSAPPGHL